MKLNLRPAVLLDAALSTPVGWDEDTSTTTQSWMAALAQGWAGADAEGAWQVLWLEWLALKGHICSLAGHKSFAAPVMKTLLST